MLPKIIFFTAVSLAILSVILLALFSPIPHKSPPRNNTTPSLSLSLYIQQPQISTTSATTTTTTTGGGSALVFRRTITEGPANTSRPVGKAQGFIIPVERFGQSAFNLIHLTFATHEYSGSLSVEARNLEEEEEELRVVGGTGSFAFARGVAVFAQTDGDSWGVGGSGGGATYHVKLKLKFPNRSQTIPG